MASAVRGHSRRSAGSPHLLSFFGLGFAVHGDVPDLAFHFGPHVVHRGRVDLSVEISPAAAADDAAGAGNDAAGVRQMCVRRSDGLPLLRRQVRGWSNVPPPIPPFPALADRVALVPAVVLAKGRTTIALIGSALSPKSQIALSLACRSWRFVSTQFLVLDRRSNEVLPYLVPLELRGAAVAEAPRSGMATGSWRSRTSPLTGEVLLARPESLGAVERVDARLPRPHLVGLCRTSGTDIRLRAADFDVQTWPSPQKSPVTDLPKLVLELPAGAVSDEAAERINDWFGSRTSGAVAS